MTDDDVLNNPAADADAAEERKLQRQLEATEEEQDIRWLMGSKRGRRIVWRLLEASELFTSTFVPDALRLAFVEGKRHFGGNLLSTIHAHCPELYPVMVKERKQHVRRNDGDGTDNG